MSNEVGVISRASIVERYGVSVEHIPTGVDSFGIVVNALTCAIPSIPLLLISAMK